MEGMRSRTDRIAPASVATIQRQRDSSVSTYPMEAAVRPPVDKTQHPAEDLLDAVTTSMAPSLSGILCSHSSNERSFFDANRRARH